MVKPQRKNQCPSCFQPVAPTDFLCPSCELILDPSRAPSSPREVSVVRRLLEAPQRGVPKARPGRTKGITGPTRVLDLGPELNHVPVVVATLSRKAAQLSELEAWVVSLIDGVHDGLSLRTATKLSELELRAVLSTLHHKHIIDFADEPPTEAFELPLLTAEISPSSPTVLEIPPLASPPPPQRAPGPPPPPLPSPPRHASVPLPPKVAPSSRPASPTPATDSPRVSSVKVRQGGVPAYPARPAHATPIVKGSSPPAQRDTDPRIAHPGVANQRVLEALKKVRRADSSTHLPAGAKVEPLASSAAELQARDTLQVALRMEQRGRQDEAIRFLERSIALSPEAAVLYNRLGIILLRERADLTRAEKCFRKALDLSPDNGVYQQNLRQVVARLALKAAR